MEIFISVRSFLYNTHCWWVLSLSLSLPLFRTEVKLRVRIHISVEDNEMEENKGTLAPDWVWINNIDNLDHLRAEGQIQVKQ